MRALYSPGFRVRSARDRALRHPGCYPEPVPERRQASVAAQLRGKLWQLRQEVYDYGFVFVDLDRVLTGAEIKSLGQEFGELMPESDESIAPFVTDGVVLDLPTVHGPDAGTSLEPFSSGPLRMHTEA